MSPLSKDHEGAASLVTDQLRAGRYDEALVRLYEEAERRPSDRTVREAIQMVRERMAEAAIAKLGSLDSVPRATHEPPDEPLGADESYLLSCVDDKRTIEELLRISTLGRHRTARVLAWLVTRGLVNVHATTAVRPLEPLRNGPIESVLVADANATQASLVRTMLRVSLGRTIAFQSATNADELIALAGQQRPGLVVLDYRLPGRGDGIVTLRALRAMPGLATLPAVLLVQRIELDYVEAQLPALVAVLARPVNRESLDGALRRVAPGAIAR